MNFMYKLERKFGRYAIKNLSLILIICYAAGYIMDFINPSFLYWLTLDPYAIAHGQFKSDLLLNGAPAYFRIVSTAFSTYYVNMSIFLAYAATFPDNQVLLMFFIPIKVKWLGLVYGIFLVYEMISGLRIRDIGYIYPFVIGSSLLNFVVFFFTTRNYIRMNRAQRRMHREFKQNARKAQRDSRAAGVTKHRCAATNSVRITYILIFILQRTINSSKNPPWKSNPRRSF